MDTLANECTLPRKTAKLLEYSPLGWHVVLTYSADYQVRNLIYAICDMRISVGFWFRVLTSAYAGDTALQCETSPVLENALRVCGRCDARLASTTVEKRTCVFEGAIIE